MFHCHAFFVGECTGLAFDLSCAPKGLTELAYINVQPFVIILTQAHESVPGFAMFAPLMFSTE